MDVRGCARVCANFRIASGLTLLLACVQDCIEERRVIKTVFAVLCLGALRLSCAHAQPTQAWPAKPVRVIVPLAPGGSVDMIARLFAGRLSESLGQQFVVDNRAGAGGTLGAHIAARAHPDGYTLLKMSPAFAGSAALYKLPYDPLRDIAPITMIAEGGMFLAVHPSVRQSTLREFVDYTRANAGAYKYGSGGVGSGTHLATELFRQLAKVDVTHVPYKGIGAALVDLLAGQIQFYIAPGGALMPHVPAGKLRLLATTGEKRTPEMPELPAVNEVVPGYAAVFWYGFGAPARIPGAVIELLNRECARILKVPDVVKRLAFDDLKPAPTTPEQFAQRIRSDIAMWSRVVREGNIRVE
jgi:tripartite-type tricarboxylate transporter receptor subunit TctC